VVNADRRGLGAIGEPEREPCHPEPPGERPPLFPPGPGDRAAWARILAAQPAFAPAATQPDLRGVADGLALDRSRYLRLLGNGVVPLQAAYAFVWLWLALEDAG
jgi:DNA (cytosine-5)-methyltransferase 1